MMLKNHKNSRDRPKKAKVGIKWETLQVGLIAMLIMLAIGALASPALSQVFDFMTEDEAENGEISDNDNATDTSPDEDTSTDTETPGGDTSGDGDTDTETSDDRWQDISDMDDTPIIPIGDKLP